jgi:hypothetical protein
MTKLALDTETNGFTATVEHDPHGADESPRKSKPIPNGSTAKPTVG